MSYERLDFFFFLMSMYGDCSDEMSIIYEDNVKDLLGSKVKIISHPDNVLLPSFPLLHGYLIQGEWFEKSYWYWHF